MVVAHRVAQPLMQRISMIAETVTFQATVTKEEII